MKTSQTWNQAFEEMRFDLQSQHLIVEQCQNRSPQPSMFQSQQIPNNINHTNHTNQLQEYVINLPQNDSIARAHQRYQYSQTEQARSIEGNRKIEEQINQDKSIRILDISSQSNTQNMPSNFVNNIVQLGKTSSNPQIVITQKLSPPHGKLPPHYPQQNYSLIPEQSKQANGLKSFQSLRLATQQSYAPSQKTLVMAHGQGIAPNDPVYHSHVATQRLQGTINRAQKKMMASPGPKIGFQTNYGAKSVIFNSQIPQGYTTNRSQQIPMQGEVQWWREKCEYQRQQFEAIRARDMNELESAYTHIASLEQQCLILKQSNENLRVQYQNRLQDIQKLKQSGATITQRGNQLQLKRQFDERGMLINLLKKDNQQLKKQAEGSLQLQKQVKQLQEAITLMKLELEQKDMLINELRINTIEQTEISHLDRSRAQSIEFNKVTELQMQNGRLIAQMSSRNQAHERQLRINSVKFNELADRFQGTLLEKDQTIKLLQQKNTLLQSDLNKKESLLRNLRDQLVQTQRKKIFNVHTPSPIHSTSASAINPPIERGERQQKDDNKRQMDNLRKHLFDVQRQKSILNQKIEQLEQRLINSQQISQRRRNQLQALRRQSAEQQDQLGQLEQIREIFQKKNNQLADMRQILMEKEQHSSEYELLSKENQKLKEITIRKNDELSTMSQRLYAAEKKLREQQSFNPKVQALEQEVETLTQALNDHKMEIQRLNTNLKQAQEVVSQAQFEIEKERHRQEQLESLLTEEQHKLRELQQQLATAQQKSQLLQRQLQGLAGKMVQNEKQAQLARKAQASTKADFQLVKDQLKTKINQLQTIKMKQKDLRQYKQKSCRQIQGLQSKQTTIMGRKNQQIQTLQQKCKQQQLTLKHQKQKLSKIQPQLNTLRQKMVKHHDCQKTIENLTDRIGKYQLNMLKSPHARRLFGDPSHQSHIFQNLIIYQLKNQNDNLKRISYRVDPHQITTNVKSRLGQFATHLNETIQGKDKSLLRVRSQDNFRLQTQPISQINQSANFKEQDKRTISAISLNNLEALHKQQLKYYKQIKHELEQRVTKLIELNKQLKGSLASVGCKDSEMKEFYQSQLAAEKERSQRLEKEAERYRNELKRFQHKLSPAAKKQESKVVLSKTKGLNQAENF